MHPGEQRTVIVTNPIRKYRDPSQSLPGTYYHSLFGMPPLPLVIYNHNSATCAICRVNIELKDVVWLEQSV